MHTAVPTSGDALAPAQVTALQQVREYPAISILLTTTPAAQLTHADALSRAHLANKPSDDFKYTPADWTDWWPRMSAICSTGVPSSINRVARVCRSECMPWRRCSLTGT
jgi:hypothetical protein